MSITSFPATIWHNPDCGTSRNTLALLRHAGAEPTIVFYLQSPLAREQVIDLIHRAGLGVRQALREKDTPYAAWGLDDTALGDDALLDAIMRAPILLNRPFVETPMGVRLCRPSEVVLEILPPLERPFIKEDGEIVPIPDRHRSD
jgi:arsenate reductase